MPREFPQDVYFPPGFPYPGAGLNETRAILLWDLMREQKGLCVGCGKPIQSSGPISIHEAIVTRGDVQGWPRSWRVIIHNKYNCILVHQESCHKHGDREKWWEYKISVYGEEEMKRWYYSLPFKVFQRRF